MKGVEWRALFAPLRGLNEVQAIVNGKSSLKELNDAEWRGPLAGIAKVSRFYHSQGYVSFTMILMSGPIDEHLDYFDLNLKIVSRIGVQQFCFIDAWAVPYLYLLWDGEAVEEPIHLSKKLKAQFDEERKR